MGLSARWVRKLLARRRKEGDGGIVHRLRGRRSNRRIGSATRERVMAEVRQRYADFGPTLAAERLAEEGPAGKPGDATEVDSRGGIVAGEKEAAAAGACVAAEAGGAGRAGDDGHVAVPLAGGARAGAASDRHDR